VCAIDRIGCDEEKSQGIVTLQPAAWLIVRKERASEAVDVRTIKADATNTSLSIEGSDFRTLP
jgi:hypothetical protein